MTSVVAAVIERDGKILICQRRRGQAHELKWEFPGGKLESGESPVDALRRELREELAIEATPADEITRYEYSYPGRAPILLIFYRVTEFDGEPQNQVFERMEWEPRGRLVNYDFLEGDVDFVKDLCTVVGPATAEAD
jgi:8-oxo-dGTP diphosphatase